MQRPTAMTKQIARAVGPVKVPAKIGARGTNMRHRECLSLSAIRFQIGCSDIGAEIEIDVFGLGIGDPCCLRSLLRS
jgi:hypothetical protein